AWRVWKKMVMQSCPESQGSGLQSNAEHTKLYHSDVITLLPEVKHNPFQEDIIRCFSKCGSDGRRYFGFDQFLDLLHVMSPRAPQDVKAHYAFKLYDADEDGRLSMDDLDLVIRKLTGSADEVDTDKEETAHLSSADRRELLEK
ncbi:calcium and integrin-binding protein 1-like, partial [Hyalella azteca]|uniref:Calcium and integrin-binding protein 1-like n=1 Tax=Hyalella azteca TaxID=294128 RepID=A0A8B7PG67_HYAAZ